MNWKEKVAEIWKDKNYRFTAIAIVLMIIVAVLQFSHVLF